MPTSGSGSATAAVGTGYPTASDLEAYFEAMGITLTAAQSALMDEAIAAGIAQFEGPQGVDRIMLASAGSRLYDPPGHQESVLFIDDFATVTSVTYQPLSATAETLTANTDYWLEPHNSTAKGRPYTRIRFRRYWSSPIPHSLRRSITVTGTVGYAASVPPAAAQGMLAAGAMALQQQISYAVTGGRRSYKDDEVSEEFGDAWKAAGDLWRSQFAAAVAVYRRMALG